MFDGVKHWVTCRVCHNSQNISIKFFKQLIIKKIVGYVGRSEIRTSICKKHIHWFFLFMVGKNIIQIGNMCGCSSWIVLVRANSKMTMSRIWSVEVKPTQSIILQLLTIYARNRFLSFFAFFAEWYVVERCICFVETIVNRRLFDGGVILHVEHFQITIRVYFNYLTMKKQTQALRYLIISMKEYVCIVETSHVNSDVSKFSFRDC